MDGVWLEILMGSQETSQFSWPWHTVQSGQRLLSPTLIGIRMLEVSKQGHDYVLVSAPYTGLILMDKITVTEM